MSRKYAPLRLTPDEAGKLQGQFNQLQSAFTKLSAAAEEMNRQIKHNYGAEALWQLQDAVRRATTLAELKREVAA